MPAYFKYLDSSGWNLHNRRILSAASSGSLGLDAATAATLCGARRNGNHPGTQRPQS